MDDWDDLDEGGGAKSFKVCRLEQLTGGRGRVVFAGTTRVAVFRIEEEIYAIKNACPHAGGSLGVGDVEGLIVNCPRHDWRFNVATGACLGRKLYKVQTYPVEVRGDEVWVEMPG